MSYPGRSPRCFGVTKLGAERSALNTVEKSADGIVGVRQATLLRHCNVERRSPARQSRNAEPRRPERYPERGLKERRSRLPRNDSNASGESTGRKSGGWDEADVGAAGKDAPVGVHGRYAVHLDLICRTAVYVTRSYGGVGGGGREVFPYPEWASR